MTTTVAFVCVQNNATSETRLALHARSEVAR